MGGTLASRFTGLVRNSLLNQFFSREITDAFLVAFKIPNLFRELLAEGALTNAFVPIYKTLEKEDAKRLVGLLFALLSLINGLLLLLVIQSAPWIVTQLVAGSPHINTDLAIQLTRIVFPFLAAISFSALAMGILNAEEYFFAPAWAPVALNVITIILMLVFPNHAVMLGIAFVLGALAQLCFQLPALWHYKLLPYLPIKAHSWWHPELASILLLMLPFTFTTSGRQVLNLLSTNILSNISAGSVTAFFNADLFLSLALGLFSISPALAYYSRLSDHAVNNPKAFGPTLEEGLKFISFLTIPVGLLLWLLAHPAVFSVLSWISFFDPARGADRDVIRLSGLALAPLGFAVFPLGLNNLLIRSFYIRKKVRLPVIITLIFLSLQAVLYIVLVKPLGIAGLSWATALVAWIQCLSLLRIVARREKLKSPTILGYIIKIWLAASIALAISYLLLQLLPITGRFAPLLELAIGGSVMLLLYLGIALLLRIPEVLKLLRR